MKRLILLACVLGLVFSSVGAVMASESYWTVWFRAGVYEDGSNYSSTVTVGARPDPPTAFPVMFSDLKANLATGPYLGQGHFADSDNPPPYQFMLTLAVGADYPSSMVYISAWTPETYIGTSGRSLPEHYLVNVQGNGVDITWTYSDLYVASNPVLALGELGPVGFWYGPVTRADSFASGDTFLVTVYAVPEPASIVALGSGLLGMAGFALRRRRA